MAVLCERSPRGPLAPHAFEQLRAAVDFVNAAKDHHPGMQRMTVCEFW